MFEKKKIKWTLKWRKRTFKRKNYAKKKNKWNFVVLKWIWFLFISFFLFSIILWVVLYKKYIEPLPPVEEIKNMHIAQTSIIYDKDENELYKIFKENRTYVDYKDINPNMVNALVAWEDQRFWTTPWFDLIWIARATLFGLISWDFRWTSWLSQQLMKVTYLTSERSIERKVKEFYLSWKLNKVFDKEKIVELYLNKIFFGSNAYWIEQASKTFFGVNASELDILQSSILASLPKAPSGLSPYNHKDKLIWYPYILNTIDSEEKNKLLTKASIEKNKIFLSKLIKVINDLSLKNVNWNALICWIDKNVIKSWTFRIDSDWCTTLWFDKLLNFLNSIVIKDWDSVLEYQTWRKDYILWRMLEDWYIDFDVYKESILSSFWYEFKKYRTNIRNPYFVMYVKDYLVRKYGEEIIEQWWFKIYTTLDSKLQIKAEELVEKYWKTNETKFWAKNTAMVSLNNKTWWIVTMVWWRDYFDEENGWNNNMITSRLQPGSTFKPFVYALAVNNSPIGSKTPIYDLKTRFPGWYIPNNFDWKFEWKMNLSTALNNSRNIPAIKMFYLAWGEEKVISFMEKLWVKTLRAFKEEYKIKYPWKSYSYAAPMALWTWLMSPLELAWAYSTFANNWINNDINPIIKIIDRKWNVIEWWEDEDEIIEKEPSISPDLTYVMNTILSDTSTRPVFWNSFLSIEWRQIAAKTWTSTKQYTRNWRKIIAPRNLWTIWYTPQITTVVWAWNTNWKELYLNWNWLEAAGPIMINFMKEAHKWVPVENWKKWIWVKTLNVSNVSWLLPSVNFPEEFLISSNFVNSPKEYDESLKLLEVDTLCDWKVTNDTPRSAIKRGYLMNFHSINPSNSAFEGPVIEWIKTWEYKKAYWNYWNIITTYNDKTCSRAWISNAVIKTNIADNVNLFIWNNNIDLAYRSDRGVVRVEVYIWDLLLKTVPVSNKTQKGLALSINIPANLSNSNWIMKFRVIDNEYYSYDKNININILATDTIKPVINISSWDNITLDSWSSINVIWNVVDTSTIQNIKYFLNWFEVNKSFNTKKIKIWIDSINLNPWVNTLEILATDSSLNTTNKKIIINLSN